MRGNILGNLVTQIYDEVFELVKVFAECKYDPLDPGDSVSPWQGLALAQGVTAEVGGEGFNKLSLKVRKLLPLCQCTGRIWGQGGGDPGPGPPFTPELCSWPHLHLTWSSPSLVMVHSRYLLCLPNCSSFSCRALMMITVTSRLKSKTWTGGWPPCSAKPLMTAPPLSRLQRWVTATHLCSACVSGEHPPGEDSRAARAP